MQHIIAHAKTRPFIQRIWLFGSRAKGTHRSLSDYDLAFSCAPDCSFAEWAQFVQQEQQQLKTLLSVDWVFLNQADESLRYKIITEGIVLYEQI